MLEKTNSKRLGNKAEISIISEFVKAEIPVLLPYGDNEPYDLVIETSDGFKSVQVKHGSLKNGVIVADFRKRIGYQRKDYTSYFGLVDYMAVWCSDLDECYLVPLNECRDKTYISLRVSDPKDNSNKKNIVWAKDYLLSNVIKKL